MTSVIASLVFGGNLKIHDKDHLRLLSIFFKKTLNQITMQKKIKIAIDSRCCGSRHLS